MIPPKQNAAFVAAMEDILDVYQRPHDAKRPVVNMDEHPVQLVKETRLPVATRPGKPERYDYEYERNGTAELHVHRTAFGLAQGCKRTQDRGGLGPRDQGILTTVKPVLGV